MNVRLLAFEFSSELYGIPMNQAAEVIPLPELNTITSNPAGILGTCHQRGKSIPVIDLHVFLQRPSKPALDRSRLLILSLPDWSIGIPVTTAYVFETDSREWNTPPHSEPSSICSSELILEARPIRRIELLHLRHEIERRLHSHPHPTPKAAA